MNQSAEIAHTPVWDNDERPSCSCGFNGTPDECAASRRATEYDAPGEGPFYAYDEPTLDRADLHGCLDEDVETGDPIVCKACAYPPGLRERAEAHGCNVEDDDTGRLLACRECVLPPD